MSKGVACGGEGTLHSAGADEWLVGTSARASASVEVFG